jgi:hypothetical protein
MKNEIPRVLVNGDVNSVPSMIEFTLIISNAFSTFVPFLRGVSRNLKRLIFNCEVYARDFRHENLDTVAAAPQNIAYIKEWSKFTEK